MGGFFLSRMLIAANKSFQTVCIRIYSHGTYVCPFGSNLFTAKKRRQILTSEMTIEIKVDLCQICFEG